MQIEAVVGAHVDAILDSVPDLNTVETLPEGHTFYLPVRQLHHQAVGILQVDALDWPGC